MAKKFSGDVGDFYYHYPMGATVVTVSHGGKANAMAVAWHCSLSKSPPLYGISIAPKRATFDMIVKSGEFAVNFIPMEQGRIAAQVGGTSGSEVDKFREFGIATVPGSKVAAPILDSAYAAYECRLHSRHTLGDHEWFVGEVVGVQFEEEVLGGKGCIDLGRFRPTLYIGADRYCTTDASSVVHLERGKP